MWRDRGFHMYVCCVQRNGSQLMYNIGVFVFLLVVNEP